MDEQRFDGLTRRFGLGLTRRATLRGVAAGAVAAVAGRLAPAVTEAAERGDRKKKDRCKRAGQICRNPKDCCHDKTKRLCRAQLVKSGSSERRCCGGQGATCGSGSAMLYCCDGFRCSTDMVEMPSATGVGAATALGRCLPAPPSL